MEVNNLNQYSLISFEQKIRFVHQIMGYVHWLVVKLIVYQDHYIAQLAQISFPNEKRFCNSVSRRFLYILDILRNPHLN